MIALYWLKSLLRTTAGRTAAAAAGIALAVALIAILGVFVVLAAHKMTAQALGPGAARVIAIAADYLTNFPHQVTLLSGSFDGPVLFSQTAANLHAGVGDAINVLPPGVSGNSVEVAGGGA